jgi:raffinose/stachyose/melibiose transport system permease protein
MATQVAPPQATTRPRRRGGGGGGIEESGRTNWLVMVLLGIGALLILLPLYLTVAMAFKSDAEAQIPADGWKFPWPMHFENLVTAWNLTHFGTAGFYSLLIAAIAIVGDVFLASVHAFAVARNWEKKHFRYSFYYLLGAMFIPFPVVALSQVKIMALIGLTNPVGVGILHVLFAMPFNVLIYVAFIRGLPLDLDESARMDGCSTFGVYWRILFPLMAPMTATVAIFGFLQSWNDFQMPLFITSDPNQQTIPVIQNLFQNQFLTDFNVAFSSYLMAMIPALLGYVIAQRWVMRGLMSGAVK